MKTFKQHGFYGLSMFSLLVLLGCGSVSPERQSPPIVYNELQATGGEIKISADSKVDIVFVVDYSYSMEDHQKNLANNIEKFVEKIAQAKLIDYHIGVLPIYDSEKLPPRYIEKFSKLMPQVPIEQIKVPSNGALVPLLKKEKSKPNAPIYFHPYTGELGYTPVYPEGGPRFVTREMPDRIKILKDTLLIGASTGPEVEEFFSPMKELISNKDLEEQNRGFFRPDAHKVFVALTDSDDASPNINPAGMYLDLLNFVNGKVEKLIFTGAVIVPGLSKCEGNKDGTKSDPNDKVHRLIQLMDMLGQKPMDLCSKNFGQQLVDLAEKIRARAGEVRFQIPVPDRSKPFELWYGDQKIPFRDPKGWNYEATKGIVTISKDIDLVPKPGVQFKMIFTPVNTANIKDGRVDVIGASSVPVAPIQAASVLPATK